MTTPTVRPVRSDDAAQWFRLRCQLWPNGRDDAHRDDINRFLAGTAREPTAVLVADRGTHLIGFAELSIRPYAEGCTTDQVAFLEGWFVDPAERRSGVGRALVQAAESWARNAGCTEFASDAQPDNIEGIAAHRAVGFTEVGKIVCFRKPV